MTSRHLYFKLLLEDLKRKTWAAALEGLALFFALPVALAMTLSNITNELYGDMTLVRGQAQARTMLEFGNDYPVIMLILGIAQWSWEFLHFRICRTAGRWTFTTACR